MRFKVFNITKQQQHPIPRFP